ncbi:MAG: hypothetical protein OXG85_03755 [Chloroflexi bacterium]|nr:hypothetical protein [Chloroflexota bacterium]
MAESALNDRLTRVETRAEEYLKRGEVGPTLSRIETKLDNMKWILGAVIAFLGAITAGVIVALIMLLVQGA